MVISKHNWGVIFYILFWVAGFSYAGSMNDESLRAALSSKNIDQVLVALNDIKKSRYQGDVLPFIKALWAQDKESEPDIAWNMLDHDIVKINLTDILVQAYNNGLVDIELDKLHDYARKLLGSSDKEVAASATLVLAQIDDPEDVLQIKNTALKSKGYLFRSSVLALSMMCNPKAGPALTVIGDTVSSSEQSKFVKETQAKFSKLKQDGAYCSRNS